MTYNQGRLGQAEDSLASMRSNRKVTMKWNDPKLQRIVKMSFRQSPVSVLVEVADCLGMDSCGELVNVELPFSQLPRKTYYGSMLDYARRDNVFLKGLGVFDRTVIILPPQDGKHVT